MTAAPRRSRKAAAALAISIAAWLPLAALAVVGALPAGRRDTGSGLFSGPAWPAVAILAVPPTLLLGIAGLAVAASARSRRAQLVAGGAIAAMILTIALLTAFTSELNMR